MRLNLTFRKSKGVRLNETVGANTTQFVIVGITTLTVICFGVFC
jgi:hypothetical protein